jgi:hypothetical protein
VNGLRAGRPGFNSWQGQGILFATACRPVLGRTQLPIQWVLEAVSPGERGGGGFETDHSPPSSAEVKECMELYLHSLIHFHGVVLG